MVKFFNSELNTKTKLVSFISIRGYFNNRRKIKNELSTAIVLPMFPGVHRWRKNFIILYIIALIYKPSIVIGRSVLATQLALRLKKKKMVSKVVYDGRGAIAAEWKEYSVITNPNMLNEIHELENEVVNLSDFRIAVSEQLIKLWQKEYDYKSNNHTVIPCTLNNVFEKVLISDETIQTSRNLLGFKKEDIVFVYSGSVAGWQSFDLLNNFLQGVLKLSTNHKVLFLSDADKKIIDLKTQFPDQVYNIKVSQNKVPIYLIAGDFGVLIREQSVTNKVASPVKFAEYLACGLGVIISDNLGDYSSFVVDNKCGYNSNNFIYDNFNKKYLNSVALNNFTKKKHVLQYKILVDLINK